MGVKSYKHLDVWNKGIEIVDRIYQITRDFPSEERYVLTAQMQRAAISIPSNIAEGFNRYHNKEYRQLLYTALGSSAELETQLEVSCDLGYSEHGMSERLLEMLDHESRMLRNLIKKLS